MSIQKKNLKMILSFLLWIVGFYLVIVLLVYIFQSKLLYFPDKNLITNPEFYGLKYEEVKFKTSDEIKIHGWYIPEDSAPYTLLFCHGNAGNISHRLESIKQFHDFGLNVFIFDYRGYGQSGGGTTEQGTHLDAEAAWNYLTNEKNISPQNIILFGRSLGAAIACQLATQQNAAALIMESAFMSVPKLAAQIYPFLPVRWLSRFQYNNLENIQKISYPVLFIHSRQDEIIPFSHGKRLFSVANPPKQFLEIYGSHNDGFYVSREIYEKGIKEFLEKLSR
jgi:fermentation-respiration switch protein FrsA (DUF1100 family)